jgi:hypothetical protein
LTHMGLFTGEFHALRFYIEKQTLIRKLHQLKLEK